MAEDKKDAGVNPSTGANDAAPKMVDSDGKAIKTETAHDSGAKAPVGAVRGDVAPVITEQAALGTTAEKVKDEKRRADLIEEAEDEHPMGKDAPTTNHIPAYGQTHATPGVPYSENPLNPGVNPVILPGAAPK